jgi:hypothetical protein
LAVDWQEFSNMMPPIESAAVHGIAEVEVGFGADEVLDCYGDRISHALTL